MDIKPIKYQPPKEIHVKNNRIRTLNEMGGMALYTTKLTEECFKYSPEKKILEIGAAFGAKTLQLLRKGAYVTALDIDPKHIEHVKNKVDEDIPELKSNINYLVGDICQISKDINSNSFDGILIESVLHFMEGDRIRKTLLECYRILKNGGKIFILMSSPHIRYIKDFYNQQVEEGVEWPGCIWEPWKLNPILQRLHPPYHVLDLEELEREVRVTGFQIDKLEYVAVPHREFDLEIDGREGVMCIGVKN